MYNDFLKFIYCICQLKEIIQLKLEFANECYMEELLLPMLLVSSLCDIDSIQVNDKELYNLQLVSPYERLEQTWKQCRTALGVPAPGFIRLVWGVTLSPW